MGKLSAGLLLYKRKGDVTEVLLVHPGGPFWAKKDDGAWSVPKGEVESEEDLLVAAKREFAEETGNEAPQGELIDLGEIKISTGKIIHIWAVEHDFDIGTLKSNMLEMMWPPKSGRMQSFPEVDKAAWFGLAEARVKLHKGQATFIERLAECLGLDLAAVESAESAADKTPGKPKQTSLF